MTIDSVTSILCGAAGGTTVQFVWGQVGWISCKFFLIASASKDPWMSLLVFMEGRFSQTTFLYAIFSIWSTNWLWVSFLNNLLDWAAWVKATHLIEETAATFVENEPRGTTPSLNLDWYRHLPFLQSGQPKPTLQTGCNPRSGFPISRSKYFLGRGLLASWSYSFVRWGKS